MTRALAAVLGKKGTQAELWKEDQPGSLPTRVRHQVEHFPEIVLHIRSDRILG
jgi:hypothetical protein